MTAETSPAAPSVPQPPAPGKNPRVCRHGACRLPRQPGRKYCAEHHRELVADRMPRVYATGAALDL